MKTILSQFDSIRIISLSDRGDRRARIVSDLTKFNMTPGSGTVQFFDAIRPTSAEGFPSIGANGCFQSHLAVLQNALSEGTERLLILEDDATFTSMFDRADALIELCNEPTWDFLYPGHVRATVDGPLRWILTDGGFECTHAFAVQKRVIPSLIKYLTDCKARPGGHPDGGPMHVDAAISMFMARNPTVLSYRASKSIVIQHSSRSDVCQPKMVDAVIPQGMLRIARDIKTWLKTRR